MLGRPDRDRGEERRRRAVRAAGQRVVQQVQPAADVASPSASSRSRCAFTSAHGQCSASATARRRVDQRLVRHQHRRRRRARTSRTGSVRRLASRRVGSVVVVRPVARLGRRAVVVDDVDVHLLEQRRVGVREPDERLGAGRCRTCRLPRRVVPPVVLVERRCDASADVDRRPARRCRSRPGSSCGGSGVVRSPGSSTLERHPDAGRQRRSCSAGDRGWTNSDDRRPSAGSGRSAQPRRSRRRSRRAGRSPAPSSRARRAAPRR